MAFGLVMIPNLGPQKAILGKFMHLFGEQKWRLF